MLRASLIGYLGADATMRSSQPGTSVASFRVAVNQISIAEGDAQETVEWFS